MNLIGYTSAEETAYYRMNAHGNVVAVVDGFGETLKTYKYDAFGGLEEDGNEWLKILFGVNVKDSNPFRYCAEYYDEETEFIYLRARYYSPEIQRFISEDPIKDGINWYAYCGNCPVNYIDPFGLAKITNVMDLWRSMISIFFPKEDKVSEESKSPIFLDDGDGTTEDGKSLSPCVQQSTIELIKLEEGAFLKEAQYDDNYDRYTIGYGNDFTKESDPDMYQKLSLIHI